jgi:hypothetical protein
MTIRHKNGTFYDGTAALNSDAWMEEGVLLETRFQSAPRPCDRGDMYTVLNQMIPDTVSIRAPALRPGRRATAVVAAETKFVSIRAPALRPGRPRG